MKDCSKLKARSVPSTALAQFVLQNWAMRGAEIAARHAGSNSSQVDRTA